MGRKFRCANCDNEIIFKYLEIGDECKCQFCDWRGLVPESAEKVDVKQLQVLNSASSRSGEQATKGNNDSVAINQVQPKDENRFPAVKMLSTILRIASWIIAISFVIYGILALGNKDIIGGMASIIIGLLLLILNLAMAELLMLLLAIEENTRHHNLSNTANNAGTKHLHN